MTEEPKVAPCELCGNVDVIVHVNEGEGVIQCKVCGMSLSEDLETFPLKWNGEWGLTNYYCNGCGFNPCRMTTFGLAP